MNKASSKILSLLLAIALVIGLAPAFVTTAFAAGGIVRGSFMQDNGVPLGHSGIKVTLNSGGQVRYSTLTNSAGDFLFDNVEDGNYEVKAAPVPSTVSHISSLTLAKAAVL